MPRGIEGERPRGELTPQQQNQAPEVTSGPLGLPPPSGPEQAHTGEGKPRQELTAVKNLLEDKGLFGDFTPKGEDPLWYPLDVMHELQGDLDRKAKQAGEDATRAEKFTSWKESVQKLHMAYEIIVYPYFDERTRVHAKRDLVQDARARKSHENSPGNNFPGELKGEERSLLGRLALARGLPFDPEKRAYRYSELYTLCEAEKIVFIANEAASGT